MWDPYLSTWSEPSISLPTKPLFPPFSSLLISPSPLQSYYSPKTQSHSHKNRRSSLTDLYRHQGRFTHLTNVYRWHDLLCRDPAALTKSEETPISSDPKRKLLHPFLYSLSLWMDLIYVFGIWVLRKLLAFSLKLCLPSFFPIVWLVRK